MCLLGELAVDDSPGVLALDQPPAVPGAMDDESVRGAMVANFDTNRLALPHVQPGRSGLRAGDPGHGILVGTGRAQRYPVYTVSRGINTSEHLGRVERLVGRISRWCAPSTV